MTEKIKIFQYNTIPADKIGPVAVNSAIEHGTQIIILQASHTGGISNQGKYSYVPVIKKAAKKGILVFVLRGALHAAGEPKESRYRMPPPLYEPTNAVIKAGAIFLEKADASLATEIVKKIEEVYAKTQDLNSVKKELLKLYST